MNECCSLTRGDYAASKEKNLCHVSDSPAAAEAEINLWFKPEDILTWDHVQTT
jgi:nucleoside-diphosphate kinase